MGKGHFRLTELICKRCRHVWIPRTQSIPVVCPNCHSPYWDRDKILKKGGIREPNGQIFQ